MKAVGLFILYIIVKVISFLPFQVLYLFSNLNYYLVYYIFKYRRAVVRDNLVGSFPEKELNEIIDIEKKFYRFFCDMFIEWIKLESISLKNLQKRMKIELSDDVKRLIEEGKSLTLIASHYGNWEFTNVLAKSVNIKLMPIYKPLSNKLIDKYMLHVRSRYGAHPVPMSIALKKLLEHKKQGIPTMMMYIADQSPIPSAINYRTNFLNRKDTPIFTGPERIATKFDFPVVYYNVECVKRGYYKLRMDVVSEEPTKLAKHEITDMHVKFLEDQIKKAPEYWLWSHRRWKHCAK